jgi:hypothetical protein
MQKKTNPLVNPVLKKVDKLSLSAAPKSLVRRLLSVIGFAAVNMLAALAVILFDWNLFDLVLLYWVESLILGFYTILKMLYVDTANVGRDAQVFLAIPFFLGVYGFFCFMVGLGILVFFRQFPEVSENELAPIFVYIDHLVRQAFVERKWICLFLFFGYGVSFVSDYLRSGQFYRANLPKLMVLPIIRSITLVVMVIGVVNTIKRYSPFLGLVVIICLKIACDTFFSWLERNKLAM